MEEKNIQTKKESSTLNPIKKKTISRSHQTKLLTGEEFDLETLKKFLLLKLDKEIYKATAEKFDLEFQLRTIKEKLKEKISQLRSLSYDKTKLLAMLKPKIEKSTLNFAEFPKLSSKLSLRISEYEPIIEKVKEGISSFFGKKSIPEIIGPVKLFYEDPVTMEKIPYFYQGHFSHLGQPHGYGNLITNEGKRVFYGFFKKGEFCSPMKNIKAALFLEFKNQIGVYCKNENGIDTLSMEKFFVKDEELISIQKFVDFSHCWDMKEIINEEELLDSYMNLKKYSKGLVDIFPSDDYGSVDSLDLGFRVGRNSMSSIHSDSDNEVKSDEEKKSDGEKESG